MIEEQLNVWSKHSQSNCLIGILTNGSVKENGSLVMGRGIAKQAKDRIPGIDRELGYLVRSTGNHCYFLGSGIFSFPTKEDWRDDSKLVRIKKSAWELDKAALKYYYLKFYLPRPGCGNGRLKWEEVEPIMKQLPDNVIVCTFANHGFTKIAGGS